MLLRAPEKDDVTIALLRQTRQPTLHLMRKLGGILSKKPWELDLVVL